MHRAHRESELSRANRPPHEPHISVDHTDETVIDRLHDQLTDHARTEGMTLADIFVDRCVPPEFPL